MTGIVKVEGGDELLERLGKTREEVEAMQLDDLLDLMQGKGYTLYPMDVQYPEAVEGDSTLKMEMNVQYAWGAAQPEESPRVVPLDVKFSGTLEPETVAHLQAWYDVINQGKVADNDNKS